MLREHHRAPSGADAKRRQTLLQLLDVLTELQKSDDGFSASLLQSELGEEVLMEDPTESAEMRLEKAGAESFNRFQKRVNGLDRELRNFGNASRQLGSSVGILSSAFHLRERLSQVLFLFTENAAALFPRQVNHQKRNPPPRKRKRNAKRGTRFARPIILEEHDVEEFPNELEMLARDAQTFLRSLNDFPEFTDEVVNNTINSFEADLIYWVSCLRTYAGEFKYPAVQRYLHDLSSEMGEHLENVTASLKTCLEVGISTIQVAQQHASSNHVNVTAAATLFSAVTATTLQISFSQTQTPLANVLNSFWFCSLVFSIASTVNSLLGLIWKQALYRSPSNRVPWWVLIWIKRGPLVFLAISVAAFSVGLCVFAYSSNQHPVTSTLTTAFTVFFFFGSAAVCVWFYLERWTFAKHRGRKWLMDVLSESLNRIRRNITWVARAPPRHLKRAAKWSEERWKRAGSRLNRTSTFVRNAITTRGRAQSRASLNLEIGLSDTERFHEEDLTCASPMSPKFPFSASMPTLHQETEIAGNSTNPLNEIYQSTSTVFVPTSTSKIAASSSKMQPTPGKRRLKDIVRNEMLVRQSAADNSFTPIRQHPIASSTSIAVSESGNSAFTVMRMSQVASLGPTLESMTPVHYIQPHTALVRHLQFSPNGEYLATCSWDRTCAIFKTNDFSMTPRVLVHPQGFVRQVAWSPRGDLLLTKMVHGMKLWAPESGALRKTIDRKRSVQSVAWFPQGEAFLSVEGGEVTKLDLTGKVIDTYYFERMVLHDVAITADQERMVCVATLTSSPTGLKPSMSRKEKQIIVYNFYDREIESQVPVLHEVRDITLTKDGNFALVNYEYKAPPQLWKLDLLRDRIGNVTSRLSLARTYMPKRLVDFACFSYFGGMDDQLVLCVGKAGDVLIWDRESAVQLHHFNAQDRKESDSDLICIAWNPTASPSMFAAGCHDGTVTIWTSSPAPPTLTSSSYVDVRHSGCSTPATTVTFPPQTLAPDAPRTVSHAKSYGVFKEATSTHFEATSA